MGELFISGSLAKRHTGFSQVNPWGTVVVSADSVGWVWESSVGLESLDHPLKAVTDLSPCQQSGEQNASRERFPEQGEKERYSPMLTAQKQSICPPMDAFFEESEENQEQGMNGSVRPDLLAKRIMQRRLLEQGEEPAIGYPASVCPPLSLSMDFPVSLDTSLLPNPNQKVVKPCKAKPLPMVVEVKNLEMALEDTPLSPASPKPEEVENQKDLPLAIDTNDTVVGENQTVLAFSPARNNEKKVGKTGYLLKPIPDIIELIQRETGLEEGVAPASGMEPGSEIKLGQSKQSEKKKGSEPEWVQGRMVDLLLLEEEYEGQQDSFSIENTCPINTLQGEVSEAEVSEAEISEAEISEAEISEAEISEAEISEAEVSEAEVSEGEVSEAEISREDISQGNPIQDNIFHSTGTDSVHTVPLNAPQAQEKACYSGGEWGDDTEPKEEEIHQPAYPPLRELPKTFEFPPFGEESSIRENDVENKKEERIRNETQSWNQGLEEDLKSSSAVKEGKARGGSNAIGYYFHVGIRTLRRISNTAITRYLNAFELDDLSRFEFYRDQGLRFLRFGQNARAARYLSRALIEDPQAYEIMGQLGLCYLGINRFRDGIHYLELAQEKSGHFAELDKPLMMAYVRQGEHEKAVKKLEKMVLETPNDFELNYQLATSLNQLGEFQRAIEVFKHCLNLDQNHATVHRVLGYCLEQAGKASEAVQHLKRAVELEEGMAGSVSEVDG